MRQQAQEFLAKFTQALNQPCSNPVLFNIWGGRGVGKTTLLEQMEVDYEQLACFIRVTFNFTEQLETSLSLMAKLYAELNNQLPNSSSITSNDLTKSDSFVSLYQKYHQIVRQLRLQPVSGKSSVDAEQQYLVKKLLDLRVINSSVVRGKITDNQAIALHRELVQQLLQQHPATQQQTDLQELMLAPIHKLTQVFTEGLLQKAQSPVVLVLDNYEKAPLEIDIWLLEHLLLNTNLKPHKVRIVVAGRHRLLEHTAMGWETCPYWKRLQIEQNLVDEYRLDEFTKEQTRIYFQQGKQLEPFEVQQVYRVTGGSPYYLNWIRCEQEAGREVDFSRRHHTITNLLLQGLNSRQKQVVQIAACCRWFNRALIRHLITTLGLNFATAADENLDCFEWLTQFNFIEFFQQGYCRLNDVTRDVVRLSLWQNDPEQFHRIYALLASYFEQLADAEVPPKQPELVRYENSDWRHYMSECLYYSLFLRVSDSMGYEPCVHTKFLAHLFAARYLGQNTLVQMPYLAIAAEADDTHHPLLSYKTQKFLKDIRPAVEWGWSVLEANPIDFETLEACGYYRTQIEAALQACFSPLASLDGLAKFAALLYRSRCCPSNQQVDWLRLTLAQAERIATRSYPDFSSSLFLKVAIAFYNLGCYEAAVTCYDKATAFKPDSDAVWYDRAQALRKLGRYEEAIASYNKVLELKPEGYEAWNGCGIALRKLGRFDEALASYNKALEFKLDNSAIWYNRGIVLDELGEYEEALASYDTAIELDANDPETWYNRGITLRKLRRLEEALASYNKALEFKPDDLSAWYNRGYVLDELRRYEEAITSYDNALEFDSVDFSTWYNRGVALYQLGRFDEALTSLERATELQPNKHKAWFSRGLALLKLGRIDEAITSLERNRELYSLNPSTWYNIACCYALQGNVELALKNLEQAINLNSNLCREMAKIDLDFNKIRANQKFRSLLMLDG